MCSIYMDIETIESKGVINGWSYLSLYIYIIFLLPIVNWSGNWRISADFQEGLIGGVHRHAIFYVARRLLQFKCASVVVLGHLCLLYHVLLFCNA